MPNDFQVALPGSHPTRESQLKPIKTVWDELTDADFPYRPPSAPSNIETISLWGPRYPGQKLHPESPVLMSPIPEDLAPILTTEQDHPDIWDRVVGLCSILRGLIEWLPVLADESTTNPHGPVGARQILEYGDSFIQCLEPVRPLLPNKLTESALGKAPQLVTHVRQLEQRFDDLERALDCVPRLYEEASYEECNRALGEMEAIMVCLGVGV